MVDCDQLLYIDGAWVAGADRRPVRNRWTGEQIGTVAVGLAEHAVRAVDAAERAMARGLPVPRRARILATAAQLLERRGEEFARSITAETGKPITAARGEVDRAVQTLGWAAEETRRLAGEAVPLNAIESGAGTIALTVPEARGIAAAVTPFNFPLNLVLHKVAPALAAGCAVVFKPSDRAVLVAGLLVEVFAEAGLPAGWLNLVTGTPADVVEPWLDDPRVAVITFTGSSRVGWDLKARSPQKLHVLELGSNTAMVVTDNADLERAAADAMTAALANSGQACVSLQRLYVTRGVADRFLALLGDGFKTVRYGDPRDDATVVGPLITTEATAKLKGSIDATVAAGARLLAGGDVIDGVLEPTLLTDVDPGDVLVCEEAFGPVASVLVVDDLDEAIRGVNSSRYSLNSSIYTGDLGEAMGFAARAQAGSVLVNMPPSYRADHMPYGGVKDSGQGTEGVKYAIDELLHHKLVVFKP
ncbi:aldehyde dehydrogenase family protein [Streptosporangium sp. 'caverna']|uniref:aldehyde dehydrogenase family protein n=1 Tax=Streptosporangium sp. 'caverna' TaxID=2202249 RepID=UPI000D7DCA9E|nr:aldehyde dehydrogenase family protein [Streptosporangium sp. 'caverna']AWS41759.1 aldehyde dehydrogenase [Streptosporangium sp. 'caverna']